MPAAHLYFVHVVSVALDHDPPRQSEPMRNEPDGPPRDRQQREHQELAKFITAAVPETGHVIPPAAAHRPLRASRVSHPYRVAYHAALVSSPTSMCSPQRRGIT
jgi:hypothetical protein